MLRSTLLFLSQQPRLRRWTETSTAASILTKRFVAGRTLDEALDVTRRLNAERILVTLDHLGENVTSIEEALASKQAYLEALRRIAQEKLKACISIKLTQFGLNLSEQFCLENSMELIKIAQEFDGFVEVDMESHEYTDRTLRIVGELHQSQARVRVAIQAYLRRSADDVESLCRLGVPVRLCKGAYREPPVVAFPAKAQVNESYRRLGEVLFDRGVYPALATHDPQMIDHALAFATRRGIGKDSFEFQMLYGIRRDLQRQLVAGGHRLRLYVPYGDAWYPYLMRRLAERPANLLFLAKNLFRR
jgi:proline dehydrogenase